ncbi:hypothetical protein GCM10027073_08300 [Streptomyces chlorus]
MHSMIVVPPPTPGDAGHRSTQLRLAPGESLAFGRAAQLNDLRIDHDGVSRRAGVFTAQGAFRVLSDLSRGRTYVVGNPDGAGEHVKVGPGRLDAPVPFEFSRVVLPAAGDLLAFDVWAPRHTFRSVERHGLAGAATATATATATAPAFTLDHTERTSPGRPRARRPGNR